MIILYFDMSDVIKSDIEILTERTESPSAYTAKDFIESRRRITGTAPGKFPRFVVFSFFQHLSGWIRKTLNPEIIAFPHKSRPYLCFFRRGLHLGFISPGFGAPAAASLLDETLALGAEAVVFIGTAGSMTPAVQKNDILLPVRAIRDEGTSFHYASPARYAFPDLRLFECVKASVAAENLPFSEGTVWSTDAPYRETADKLRRLRAEGCIAVDMEASALFAVADHYGKNTAGILLATDDLTGRAWNPLLPDRNTEAGSPRILLELALEALCRFSTTPDQET
jgi:uridine phosphorylase